MELLLVTGRGIPYSYATRRLYCPYFRVQCLVFQNSMNPIPPTKPARSMAPNAPDVRWIAPLPGPWSEPLPPPEVNVAVAGTREILMEEVIVYYGGSAGDHETGALTLMTIPACPLVVSVPVCVKVITTTPPSSGVVAPLVAVSVTTGAFLVSTVSPRVNNLRIVFEAVTATTTVTSSWPTDSTLLSQSQSQTCFLWYDFTLEHSLL